MPTPRKNPSSSSPKRERRGEAAGRALVAAWEASGLPQAAFARRRGVSAQRLSYWRLRLGQRGKGVTIGDAGFVEIPSAASTTPLRSGDVVVEVSGGVRVHVTHGFDPVLLRAVVSALAGPVPTC
jgi:hypothetical protein